MVAVAFVVDSSAALAAEWATVMSYIMQMLRRLTETQGAASKMRVAFVTYGTQGTPLVCKNFFMDLQPLVTAFRDEAKLGIGQTSYGGNVGMAALEGFVAALELFDTLGLSAQSNGTSSPQYIIHIAATVPDDSERPQCNLCPTLDFVTWDSLPAEMKKRNIHLSSISLRPNLHQFSNLHSICSSSTIAPWFPVRPTHSVLLSGYPTKGVKRAGEVIAAEKTPDPKRAKISSPNTNTSPNISAQTPPAPLITTPTSTPARTITPSGPPVNNAAITALPPPAAPMSAPPMPRPGLSQQQIQQIQNTYRAAEAPVRALEAAITEARTRGDNVTADSLMVQWKEKNNAYLKLKQNIATMLNQHRMMYRAQQMAAAQQQGQNIVAHAQQGQPVQPGQTGLGSQPGPASQHGPALQGIQAHSGQQEQAMPPQPGPTPQDVSDVQMGGPESNDVMASPPTTEAMGHTRSLSGGAPRNPMPIPTNPAGVAPSPMMQQQIQKMLEQKERAKQSGAAMRNALPVWQGPITWSGTNPAGEPREISTYVIASSLNREACHAATWPTSLTLTISEKHAVPMSQLQAWMKNNNPAVCTFAANPRAPNAVNNEMGYKALVALLSTKNYYFVSSWALPNGKVSNNVLIFPVQNAGLVGAFFPLEGLPDLPQGDLPPNSSIVPNPTAPPLNQPPPPQTSPLSIINYLMAHGVNITPPFAAQLGKMNQADRNVWMQKLIQAGIEQRRQRFAVAQAQAGAPMGVPQMGMMQQMGQQPQPPHPSGGFNSAQFNMGGTSGASGGMGGPAMYSDMMGGLPRPAGGANSGGSGGAVSYEMMQSFMARNQQINGGPNVGS